MLVSPTILLIPLFQLLEQIMEKEFPQVSQTTPHLNLALLSPEHLAFANQPEQYLLSIILQDNPWPSKSEPILRTFLEGISALYNPVAYHNITHAFDVMTSFDQYLTRYGWQQRLKITPHQRIFMLIAAYAHDAGHQGLTNAYYKNSKHQLALNATSPLEQMHVGKLKRLMRQFQLDLPVGVEQDLTEMILKTDNFYHNWMLTQFQSLGKLSRQELSEAPHALVMNCILLHSADLNNAAKDIQLSIGWTNHLYIQFEKQALLEQQQGLPVSFIKPSTEAEYIDSNVAFINHMIIPLFRGISDIQERFEEVYARIIKNRAYWLDLRSKLQQ